jgi:hypothetical protein
MKKLFARIDALVNKLVKNYTLWIFVGLILLGVLAVVVWHAIFPPMPEPAVYGSLRVLEQGWSEARREKYYQTSQGNPVMPFSWYMSLERQPQGFPPEFGEVDLFSSPKVQARYGLLPDTSRYNPYQLPVGIVPDVLAGNIVDLLGQGQPVWMGMSCAACHTGQILYKGRAVRIDGGQAMWNFSQWSTDLVANLTLTAVLPDRFDRFATRVFKFEGIQDSTANRRALRQSLEVYFNSPLIRDAIDAVVNHTYPAVEGNARTAALGRGVNGEFGLLDPRNIDQNRGPVSFPPLWYTHDFDWVQSVAAILQPMGRNITEAWGVNVQVELNSKPDRYLSTVRLNDMFWIETLLSVLEAPRWPEEILGKIDWKKVERGRYLYEKAVWNQVLTPAEEQLPPNPTAMIAPPNPNRVRTGYCARCHSPAIGTDVWESSEHGYSQFPNSYIQLPLYRQHVLDTDPYDAKEFNARNPYMGVVSGDMPGPQLNIGAALTGIVSNVEERWYDDRKVPPACREIMNGFRPMGFRAPLGYPARPMAGYWATGPFLHNGSVRTLYQLISPVSEREKTFYMGSFEFDPREVGYQNQRIDGAFLFDTRVPGNLNTGHEFNNGLKGAKGVIGPYLTPADRLAIVEYMKVVKDVRVPPETAALRRALLDRLTPFYEGKPWTADPADVAYMRRLCATIEPFMAGISGEQNYIASQAPEYDTAAASAASAASGDVAVPAAKIYPGNQGPNASGAVQPDRKEGGQP